MEKMFWKTACSEAHQQAGDFVMHWYVNEMSKSIKYMGFKFDAGENNPRKTGERKPNAQNVPNDICPWMLLLHLECNIS